MTAPGTEDLDDDDVRRIIELVEAAPHVSAIHLKAGDIEIDLRKPQAESAGAAARAMPVKSSLVGTFYRGPDRGGRPFVETGGAVTPETTLGMIEVLAQMHPVRAGVNGVVARLAVDDGAPVEFGQVLAVIDPVA